MSRNGQLSFSKSRKLTLKIGDTAPDFALNTVKGNEWRLSAQLGKVTALLFYPKNETLVCTRQMCSVRDNWEEYLKTKAVVVGISPGTTEEHRNFSQHHGLPLTLLADVGREITKIYTRHQILPVQFTRAIVIVDAKGIIRYRRIMLRAFRPTDRSVLASIYAARTDALQENFDKIIDDFKTKKINETSD
jgi:thioredoxin-dependent peroxiredoxin